ncbi:hypothetical protein OHB54_02475 [Streptomyces sp. NBC_01007]|nr:hypothetical protein OHB54_02475 [Streptomyces sp. NBC_01007]
MPAVGALLGRLDPRAQQAVGVRVLQDLPGRTYCIEKRGDAEAFDW